MSKFSKKRKSLWAESLGGSLVKEAGLSWCFSVAEIWIAGETGESTSWGGDDKMRQGAMTEKSLVRKALNKLNL